MVGRVAFKVCGITREEDAGVAAASGADYLGFNFYGKSPRAISLARFKELKERIPGLPRVAVAVLPEPEEVEAWLAAGIDRVQIHYGQAETDPRKLEQYCQRVGRERLWLAPRLAPGDAFDQRALDFAGAILFDGYKAGLYGGTGRTSDWAAFRRLRQAHPATTWILAGGLGPENLAAALEQTGATHLDFNSGVEVEPGIKDPAKLQAVQEALRNFDAR